MFKQPWSGPYAAIALATVLGAVSLWIVWGQSSLITEQRVHYDYSSGARSKVTEYEISSQCTSLVMPALGHCIRNAIDAEYQYNSTQKDLIAQQVMARFTRIMGYASVLGIVLGVVSMGLIWGTLIETQNVTKKTREAARDQSRAYVHIDSVELYWGDAHLAKPKIKIKVVNTGQTPAKWFRVSALVKIHQLRREDGLPQLDTFEQILGSLKEGVRYDALSGKGFLVLDVNEIDIDALDVIQDAVSENTDHVLSAEFGIASGIAVYGLVEYETFFGEIFTSQFCYGAQRPRRYKNKIIRETPINDAGGTWSETEEVPLELSRLPVHCQVYKKQDA